MTGIQVDQQSLKYNLERLREALDNADPIDDALKAELSALDADIRRVLDAPAPAAGLVARSRELALKFSAEHPTAAAVLRELGVLLEGIGA